MPTPRFQRARCCGWPLRNFERKSNSASTKRFDSKGAMSSAVRNASHAFSVSRSVVANTSAILGKAVFCDTNTRSALHTPAAPRKVVQGKPDTNTNNTTKHNTKKNKTQTQHNTQNQCAW